MNNQTELTGKQKEIVKKLIKLILLELTCSIRPVKKLRTLSQKLGFNYEELFN